jgi:hypothetical protein
MTSEIFKKLSNSQGTVEENLNILNMYKLLSKFTIINTSILNFSDEEIEIYNNFLKNLNPYLNKLPEDLNLNDYSTNYSIPNNILNFLNSELNYELNISNITNIHKDLTFKYQKYFFNDLEKIELFNNISEFNDFFKQIINNYQDIEDINLKKEYHKNMHMYINASKEIYKFNGIDYLNYIKILNNLRPRL